MFVIAAAPDPLLTDILIPSAAILISTPIALLVVGLEQRSSKRERRSEPTARVAQAISRTIADCSRSGRGDDVDLEATMSDFDAAVIQWSLAAKRSHRVVVASIRDTMFMAYLNRPDELDAVAWSTRSYLQQWALGNIPLREFRRYAAWGGAAWPWKQRTLSHAWYALLASARESASGEHGASEREIHQLERLSNRQTFVERVDGWQQRVYSWWYRR